MDGQRRYISMDSKFKFLEETPEKSIWHYKSAKFPPGEKLLFIAKSDTKEEKRFVDSDDIEDLPAFIQLNRIHQGDDIPKNMSYYIEVLSPEAYKKEVAAVKADRERKRNACIELHQSLGWTQDAAYEKCSFTGSDHFSDLAQ
jgi:hypothetical protein